ncbi:glycoside hydrolase family 73 protein [Burkholderia gladioli]|uniref:glycoside hydrolase family 73 protein n=1 Tax=Burkholderia gladioli TaxID=28095 RepID=UPI00163EE73F|nr:glucosaminidase domain-containing protein [Burkholderia gladioli]
MADILGFVQQYAPVAAAVGQRIGVSPDVLLGQWGLETGWGKSVVPGTNNLGNIKGAGVAATDNQTGSTDQYRAYATPAAFGSDFANLITGRYQGALGTGSDAAAYGKALQSGGYAEDSKYASKLSGAVDMVRKFGSAIASALSGSASAAELTPAQQGAAPVISPTGQQINPASPGAAPASPGSSGAPASSGSSGDPLLDMASGVMSGKPVAAATPSQPAAAGAMPSTSSPTAPGAVPAAPGDDPLLAMANSVMSSKTGAAAPAAATSAPASSASPAAAASWPGGELGRQLGLTARAAGHGIADAVDLVGAPLNATINTLFGAHLHNPGDAIRSATDAVTPAPQNALERVINAGAAGMAGAGPLAKAGTLVADVANPIIRAIGTELAAAPGSQIIGGATGAMSSQAAAQAGANPLVQMLAGAVGGGAGFAGARGAAAGIDRALAAGAPAAEIPAAARVEPSMPQPGAAPGGGAASAAPEAQPGSTFYTDSQGNTSTAAPTGAPANAQASSLRGVGAAQTDLNPYAGQLTGEEAARGGSSAFPQVKVAKGSGDVSPAEQVVRAQIANEVLGPENDAVRTGVITGNEDALRSEYTLSRSSDNTPEQVALRAQIAREQQALSNYAQDRIAATGANPNLINNEQRGQVINDAFFGPDSLNDYFQQAKNQIYDQARIESGGNPIRSTHVDDLLSDPQFLAEAERSGNSRVISGISRLIDLARSTGFRDPITGETTAPGSVAAWDAVRKSNNADWNDGNARTLGAINRAIDQDIAAAAGSDAYKMGDALHQAQQTITGARGFRQAFGDADPNGVKTGAALEQIPARLNNMPLDQWRHIYNTLDDLSRGRISGAPEGIPAVPVELQQQAAAARDEMSGALAREVYEQGAGKSGVWNQNSANKTLNSVVGQKILETFPPDEIQRFHALNYAGQIMPGVHSYEGAGLQTQRLAKGSLFERHAQKVATSIGGGIGGAVGGPAGATLGGSAGSWAGNKLAQGAAATRLQGDANRLLDAMRANSKKGR